jgi:hypothetical protein
MNRAYDTFFRYIKKGPVRRPGLKLANNSGTGTELEKRTPQYSGRTDGNANKKRRLGGSSGRSGEIFKRKTTHESLFYNVPLTLKIRTNWGSVEVMGSCGDGVYDIENGYLLVDAYPDSTVTIRRRR